MRVHGLKSRRHGQWFGYISERGGSSVWDKKMAAPDSVCPAREVRRRGLGTEWGKA